MFLWGWGGGSQLSAVCLSHSANLFCPARRATKQITAALFLGGPTCSHFKLSQRAAAYSNIQQNYETKGPGPLSAAPVSRITSQTHSPATKASIVRQPSPRISSGGDCTLNWA